MTSLAVDRSRLARAATGGAGSSAPPADIGRLLATYILPLRRDRWDEADPGLEDLTEYLKRLSGSIDVVVVDGSPPDVYRRHRIAWQEWVEHVSPDADIDAQNGKVRGVVTGLRRATTDAVVIADDDVRYDEPALHRLVDLLDRADVVRPQNHFVPMPWHARWDTARTLLNRATGGDWPGTLGVRRSRLLATDGYDGDVLFENLELVRTVQAAGGRELVAFDLYVPRRPPDAGHFWSQRVRQAYDEFARPIRLAVFLSVLPGTLLLLATGRVPAVAALLLGSVALAESGRRRSGGTHVFPATASLMAPLWLAERAVCSWLAVASRLRLGGVRYRGGVLARAATPTAELRRRHSAAGARARGIAS